MNKIRRWTFLFVIFVTVLGMQPGNALIPRDQLALAAEPASCIDSDGGQNYEVAGYVSGIGQTGYPYTKYDVCETGTYEGSLKEYFCDGTTPKARRAPCEYGCADGACLSPLPTPTPTSTPTPTCIDADMDGYAVEGGTCGPVDCNDAEPLINPGAMEACGNGLDDNCNGKVDDQDPACSVRPNIVIIMTDDQNVDSLPVMRKLLAYPEGSWVNFKNAYANNSLCCPARVTVLTGQYSHNHGVTTNNEGANFDDTNSLVVWLDKAGYRTGLIGKYLNNYPWDKGAGYVPPGWDFFQPTGGGETNNPGNADERTSTAVNFINTSTAPFFLYLAYDDPHYPARPVDRYANAEVYIPPTPLNFNEADISDKPTWVQRLPLISQSTMDAWNAERVNSQRALLAVDDGIESIVNALKANGQLDNTMIIFMSDHGFSWGSHRYYRKQCEFEECSKIPLFFRYPGLTGNREESRLASNVDLAATIAGYVGITPELPQDGRSLIPIITDTATSWNDEILLEKNGNGSSMFFAIRVTGWKYVEMAGYYMEKQLYDLTNDPFELQNLANMLEYQAIQAYLAERLQILKGN